MEAIQKKILKAVSLEIRRLLEGKYDAQGQWQPGDLEQRLAAIGVRRDRSSMPVDELPHLAPTDVQARKVVDAYLQLRTDAGASRQDAVAELVRETAYSWANRLLALRCMESRGLIDEVILEKETYGGRSLELNRLAKKQPELCAGEDDGRFAMLERAFSRLSGHLPQLFDPDAAGVALRPSAAALKRCFALLSGTEAAKGQDRAGDEVFQAPDALGWAYQYWNSDEKDRVFERVRTLKGAKIAGPDIIPATQLYTESYMVQFLVQNSLGATWMGMHPESPLFERWNYYVRDADRAPVTQKPLIEITFLDPACGSGHFLLVAFDLLYDMYVEDGTITEPAVICDAILTRNLYGIDIDARAVQIAEASLWMKAAERVEDYRGVPTNLVAAVASHLKGPEWEKFLGRFEKEPSVARVLRRFAKTMEHIDELGSLARPAEDLEQIVREEHAVWEKQVREQKEANYLFSEMRRDSLSGHLPFEEITDEQFGHRLMNRARMGLDAFTKEARERGDFQDQFVSRETSIGFKLLNVLGLKYDVVAANPPYMGSKNMGRVVKEHLRIAFPQGKRDVYAAFICRTKQLARHEAYIAIVTQQSWMFLSSFESLRQELLNATTLCCLAHLGRYAFEEITNAVVAPVLACIRCQPPNSLSTIRAFRLTAPRESAEQARLLREGIAGRSPFLTCSVLQGKLGAIPGSPILYWLPASLLGVFTSNASLSSVAKIRKGIDTGHNQRFLRWFWEIPTDCRWKEYAKGGGHCKWYGLRELRIDWRSGGANVFAADGATARNLDFMGRQGLTYTVAAQGSLSVRRMMAGTVFDSKSAGIFANDEPRTLAHLNSRFASFLLRCITPSLDFNPGYLARLVIPHLDAAIDTVPAKICVIVKGLLDATSPVHMSFSPSDAMPPHHHLLYASCLHSLEGENERQIINAFRLGLEETTVVFDETGYPPAFFRLLEGYSQVPGSAELDSDMTSELSVRLGRLECTTPSQSELISIQSRLKHLYEGVEVTEENDVEDIDEDVSGEDGDDISIGGNVPIPIETSIERLALCLELHPVSVYWLLKDGIDREGWRCLPQERRGLRDHLVVDILRLLGHRWPRQIESGEQPPEWADPDGIIPLTECPDHERLLTRLRQRWDAVAARPYPNSTLAAEEWTVATLDAQVEELFEQTLDAWIGAEFIRHHTQQFKRRPIAWQLQSGPFTTKKTPAFAALIYYHSLDADLLPKLRTQYVGPLATRLQTELRGLEAISVAGRSDRQAGRVAALTDAIEELAAFDNKLHEVEQSSFGPTALVPVLRQYALDDAMLSLKVRWLRRLIDVLQDSQLNQWLDAAEHSKLHFELTAWIAESIQNLHRHCVKVGPGPPDATSLADDPDSAYFTRLICPAAAEMVSQSLSLACHEWQERVEAIVISPLKEEAKRQKEEAATIDAELESETAQALGTVGQLKLRKKELQTEIKRLNKEIKEKNAASKELRATIERYALPDSCPSSPDACPAWLSQQPLYDNVASLDGRRPPPASVKDFIAQESAYVPDINDGVRVNIAPLQSAGLLAADVLAAKDVPKAIADRAAWRADERRWVREGKLPQPGWWPEARERDTP